MTTMTTPDEERAGEIASEIADAAVGERNNQGMYLHVAEFAKPLIAEAISAARREEREAAEQERKFADGLRSMLYWIAIEYGGKYKILSDTIENYPPSAGRLDLSTEKSTGDLVIAAIRGNP